MSVSILVNNNPVYINNNNIIFYCNQAHRNYKEEEFVLRNIRKNALFQLNKLEISNIKLIIHFQKFN